MELTNRPFYKIDNLKDMAKFYEKKRKRYFFDGDVEFTFSFEVKTEITAQGKLKGEKIKASSVAALEIKANEIRANGILAGDVMVDNVYVGGTVFATEIIANNIEAGCIFYGENCRVRENLVCKSLKRIGM